MIRLKLIVSILLLLSFSALTAQAQGENAEVTRIGRGAVQSVEWHPSGDYVLVSTITGAWLYTSELEDMAHLPDAWLATISPDGRYIAGVDADARIRLWDATTLDPIESPDTGYFSRVKALAWSYDGRYLAVAGSRDQDLIHVWDFFNSQETVSATLYSADKLLWSPDAHRLAMINSQSGGFAVFDIAVRETLVIRQPIDAPHGSHVVWQGPDNLIALDYGENTDASLWSVITGEEEETWRLPGHAIAYSNRTGDILATGVPGGVMLSHADTEDNIRVQIDPDYFGAVEMAWDNDNRWLAAGTYSISKTNPAETLLIDPQTGEIVQRFGGTYHIIRHLVWSQDDRYLLAVDERQQVMVYHTESGETYAQNDAHTLVGEGFAWSPNGREFVVAGTLDEITIWDSQEVIQTDVRPGTRYPATHIEWQPDGDLIALVARNIDGALGFGEVIDFQLRDSRSGADITDQYIPDANMVVDFFDWHPEGTHFAILGNDILYVQDIQSASTLVQERDLHRVRDVHDLLWSPSGRYVLMLMFGHGLGGSYIYEVETGAYELSRAYLLLGTAVWANDDELVSLRWGSWGSPFWPRLVSPGIQRHAEPDTFYEPDYSEPTGFTLDGLTTLTRQGFISPNGGYAAAVDDADNGMLWDATTGAPLAMLTNVAQITWAPDESLALLQRIDGSLWLLDGHGTIREQLPISIGLQEPVGSFFWSPNSDGVVHLHNGVVDIWRFSD
jgi:WD40 repeat protein